MSAQSKGNPSVRAKTTTANVLDAIKKHQRARALRTCLTPSDDGYCACADDNVFQKLSPSARKEFENGDGTELGKSGALLILEVL